MHYTFPMDVSVWPINQQPSVSVREVVGHVDATGWHGAWMADHLMSSAGDTELPVLEAWTMLGALAATTTRVRLGTLVASNTFRHPGLVAKMVATLDDLASGRIVVGLGSGWQRNEHDAYGIALADPRDRLAALDEACTVVRGLLDDGELTHAGHHYRLEGARAHPRPARHVPLLLGVKGDRALALVARHADEWNLWASPATLSERRAVLERHCEAIGRDPDSIRISAQAVVMPSGIEPALRERWLGSGMPTIDAGADHLAATLADYAAAGLDELVVPDFALGRGTARLEALDAILETAATFA